MPDWFKNVAAEFQPLAQRFADKPITYVEIGVYQGNSAEWVCRNILTHPDSRGHGIDPYVRDNKHLVDEMQAHLQTAKERMYAAIGDRWIWHVEPSAQALRNWTGGEIDLLYIDGSHFAHDALIDFCFAWEFLKVGSLVVFDDWGIGRRKKHRHVPEAVEAVRMAFGQTLVKQLHEGPMQVSFEVVAKGY